MNKVQVQGRITNDFEVRHTHGGVAVCDFSLAIQGRKKENGEYEVDFIDFTAFAATAEFIIKHFKKGYGIIVTGRLSQDRWKNKDGDSRSRVKVIAEEVEFPIQRPKESEA